MLAPQIHLMLNHVPVLGALFVAAALATGLWSRRELLTRFALVVLVLIAIAAIPVYFSGGSSEESIEKLAGVHEQTIERHEDAARVATLVIVALGLASLVTLVRYRSRSIPRLVAGSLLAGLLASSGMMAWAAHLGGEIRHAEIRGATTAVLAAPSSESEEGGKGE